MELLKSFGPMTASELLDRGDIRNALSILHVAKAFEVNAGETDQLLSRAYYQRGDFCLAEDYAQSAERYLVEKKMTALEVYTDVQRIERDAAANCERSKKQR